MSVSVPWDLSLTTLRAQNTKHIYLKILLNHYFRKLFAIFVNVLRRSVHAALTTPNWTGQGPLPVQFRLIQTRLMQLVRCEDVLSRETD